MQKGIHKTHLYLPLSPANTSFPAHGPQFIDGTIWPASMIIPESTKEAIRKLKENGCYVFISSGRTRAFIQDPELLSLGFDGILSGCGTSVNFRGEELLYETLPCELVNDTLKVLKQYDMPVVLEGRTYQYVDAEDFQGDPFIDILRRDVGDKLLGITENHMNWEISKFSAVIKNDDFTKALEELSPWYDFLVHGKKVVEGVPKGFSKATGIQVICEKLGLPHENTYAFGDSVNDLDMLKYVAHGIAMGNGMPEAKAVADYVTDDIHADGIYNACKHFGLI